MFRALSLEHLLVLRKYLNIYLTISPSSHGRFKQSCRHLAIKSTQVLLVDQSLLAPSKYEETLRYSYASTTHPPRSSTHRRFQRCASPSYQNIQSANTGRARSKPLAKKVAISPTAHPSRTAKLGMQQSIHKRWLKRRLVPSATRRTSMMGTR